MVALRPDFLAHAPAHVRGTSLWAWQRDMEQSRSAFQRAAVTPYPKHARVARAAAFWWLTRAAETRRQMARVLACPYALRGLVSPHGDGR